MILTVLEIIVSVFLNVFDWIKGTILDLLFLIVAASVTVMVIAFTYHFTLEMLK